MKTTCTRRKRSQIWLISDEDLQQIVDKSETIAQVLRYFNLNNKGGNFRTLKRRFDESSINLTQFEQNRSEYLKSRRIQQRKPLQDILVEKSTFNRDHLKSRLIEAGLIDYKCARCKLTSWNDEPISLQLDHINGVCDDNRIDNLRFLCPNCHSQTENFAGRLPRKLRPSEIDPNWRRRPVLKTRRVDRPTKEELEAMLWEVPTTKIAARYGITDSAVGRWAKSYGLQKPPRGYWGFSKEVKTEELLITEGSVLVSEGSL